MVGLHQRQPASNVPDYVDTRLAHGGVDHYAGLIQHRPQIGYYRFPVGRYA